MENTDVTNIKINPIGNTKLNNEIGLSPRLGKKPTKYLTPLKIGQPKQRISTSVNISIVGTFWFLFPPRKLFFIKTLVKVSTLLIIVS